jgi:hypothetical protein
MTKKIKGSMTLELDGKVLIVERDSDNKIVSQEEIDGETVLKCLLHLLEQGIKNELTKVSNTKVKKKARTVNSGKKSKKSKK